LTTWRVGPPFRGITLAHEDIMLARTGDTGALYRVRQRRLADPDAHERMLYEIADELRERWGRDPQRSEQERPSFDEQNAICDPIVFVYL
jgi:hypothetical protein